MNAFKEWSPAALAYALGYRIDLRGGGNGVRTIYLVGPTGRARPTSHARACDALARLARWRGFNPDAPPAWHPRALVNGSEQITGREVVPGKGERLTMGNGSTWLHPFNGGAPVREN
jgi:hypothetical protein